VLFGQILNWILKFNDKVEQLLNTAMFSLIGLAYIVLGYAQDNKMLRIIAIICGVYLIAGNFFEKNTLLKIIGLICLLTPVLIARFHKEKIG